MPILSPIVSCGGSKGLCNYWQFQINNEYQTANNIWFSTLGEDVDLAEGGQITFDISTSDGTVTNSGRASDKIDNFKQTVAFTFTDGALTQFNREILSIFASSDDYIRDYLDCGMNIRKVICFPNGGKLIMTWIGNTTTSASMPATQVLQADSTFEMEFTLNEPTIQRIGFDIEISSSLTLPSFTEDVTIDQTAGTITADITVVDDPDNLIVASIPTSEEVQFMVFDEDDNLIGQAFNGEAVTASGGLTVGQILTIAYSFKIFIDSNGVPYYKTYKVEKQTVA